MAMPPDKQPRQVLSVRAKRVAASLKHYRVEARLKQSEVAARAGWSESKLGHIETRTRLAEVSDVETLLDIYGVSEDARAIILGWAREARRRNWWNEYEDVLNSGYLALEDETSGIDDWSLTLIFGLLQTYRYAEAIIRSGWTEAELLTQAVQAEVARRLEARMIRQTVLQRPSPPRLRLVIDEGVLHRPVGGPEVMREQLEHLVTQAQREFVTIQVLPWKAGQHPGQTGPMTILHFDAPEDELAAGPGNLLASPSVIHVEGFQGTNYLESEGKVVACNVAMERIRALALSPQESAKRIASAAKSM